MLGPGAMAEEGPAWPGSSSSSSKSFLTRESEVAEGGGRVFMRPVVNPPKLVGGSARVSCGPREYRQRQRQLTRREVGNKSIAKVIQTIKVVQVIRVKTKEQIVDTISRQDGWVR